MPIEKKFDASTGDLESLTPVMPLGFRCFVDSHSSQSGTESGVLGPGRPGKVGIVQGEFSAGASRMTHFTRGLVKAPYHLTRPLYIDPSDSGHAVLYVQSTGGGISENDRLVQQYECGQDTRVTITTQAATNVHRMNEGFGSSWIRARLEPGATVEFLPSHTTLYEGSRYLQRQDFDMASGSTLIVSEIVAQGRLARGERNSFDSASMSVSIACDGLPVVSDNIVLYGDSGLKGDQENSEDILGQSHYGAWLNYYALAPGVENFNATTLVEDIRTTLAQNFPDYLHNDSACAVGASELAYDAGIIVRGGFADIDHARRVMECIHETVHSTLIATPALDLRKK